MATIREIEDRLYDWVKRVLPTREVHFENQDISAPSTPYVALFVHTLTTFAHDVRTYSDDHTTQDIRGLSEVEIKVSVWDGEARQDANRLRVSLRADESLYDVYLLMGRGEVKPTVDITADYEARRTPRVEFSFIGHAALTETFDSNYYDVVAIDGVDVGTNNPPRRVVQSGDT